VLSTGQTLIAHDGKGQDSRNPLGKFICLDAWVGTRVNFVGLGVLTSGWSKTSRSKLQVSDGRPGGCRRRIQKANYQTV
jgi:hypothetical protein